MWDMFKIIMLLILLSVSSFSNIENYGSKDRSKKLMVKLNSRVKQLYQQTYNPPTNNDLNKSINDLSARINILETKLKQALKWF